MEYNESIEVLEDSLKQAKICKKEMQKMILDYSIKEKKLDKKIANIEKAIRRLENAEED